ncbi:MAG: aspartate dehydrogenase [Clostridiales bacterium]|jgi:hypothetical protein|nr:aspartate dehydrogenase [Clostridiales bacterium]
MIFGGKRKAETTKPDPGKKPVIHSSICTGEKVAGFKDLATGKFEDIMLIRNNKDLATFSEKFGIDPSEITKEW